MLGGFTLVGVNFGKTTVAKNEEEFKKLVKERVMKNPDEVNEKIIAIIEGKECTKEELK